MIDFTHLHVHTKWSLLDGISDPKDMVKQVKANGQSALAMTDHGSLYGAIEFYSAMKDAGIKPIMGCEIYVAPRSREMREPKVDDANHHLTVLAMNNDGWRSLIRIVSDSHLNGFYYKPRSDRQFLAEHGKDLICLSGCLSGEVSRHLMKGDFAAALKTATEYREIFGPDRYFIEIQDQGLTGQREINQQLIQIAHALNVGLVATNDSHYVRRDQYRAHDALLCIQTNARLRETERMKMETDQFYLRSTEEMAKLFSGVEDALRNTAVIAERCEVKMEFGTVPMPTFEIPGGLTDIQHLRKQVYAGLKWRYGALTEEIIERAEYELEVIENTGFARYFIIVADYVQHSRSKGIMSVPRGSVSGSICIYALGICDLDPLKYGLMFERFLHEERIGVPDIDMDFEDDRRAEVIEYIRQKYGEDHVAQIGAIGTMHSRAAVRDVGRVLEADYGFVDRLAKALNPKLKIPQSRKEMTDLRLIESRFPAETSEILDLATDLEGTPRNFTTHAAGITITRDPIWHIAPVQHASRDDRTVVTQWVWQMIEKIGIWKMDCLGLINLRIIHRACYLIYERTGIDLYGQAGEKLYSDLPEDYADPRVKKTFDMLSEGHATAVFQLESGGMRAQLRQVRPNKVMDLVSIVALYRPGPMDQIPTFVAAKNGDEEITYPHPELEEILEETYGVVTFQDQVLLTVRKLAGYTWGEADVLRKAIGKKLPALMEEQKQIFLTKMADKGHDEKLANKLWDIFAPFAGYGFPKGHAAAYAYVAYITAYLKANYPAEYMTAVLSAEAGTPKKVAEAVVEARRLGVQVQPADVNRSGHGFTLTDGPDGPVILFGLSAVKNVGDGAIKSIVTARQKKGAFKNLVDFCQRVDLHAANKRALESLIKAGAMDALGERNALLAGLDGAMKGSQKTQSRLAKGQMDLFGMAETVEMGEALNAQYQLPPTYPATRPIRLAWERDLVGLYVSEHPLTSVAKPLYEGTSHSTNELSEDLVGQVVTVGGMIAEKRIIPTRKGDLMAIMTLEDLVGTIDVVVFPNVYEDVRELLTDDAVLLVSGVLDLREDKLQVKADDVEWVGRSGEDEKEANAPGDFPLDPFRAESEQRALVAA